MKTAAECGGVESGRENAYVTSIAGGTRAAEEISLALRWELVGLCSDFEVDVATASESANEIV